MSQTANHKVNQNSSPIDEFSEAMKYVIHENADFVTHLVVNRQSFEDWLRVETYKRLYLSQSYACELERLYPESKERCDFYFKTASLDAWVEVKLCMTNYSKGFFPLPYPRPITNQISSIERDIQKLTRITTERASKAVFLIAYPLPVNYETFDTWNTHLQKFSGKMEKIFDIPLRKDDKAAFLVGYRAIVAG